MSLYPINRPPGAEYYHEAHHTPGFERCGVRCDVVQVCGGSGRTALSGLIVSDLSNLHIATAICRGAVAARMFAWAGANPLPTSPPDAIAALAADDLLNDNWGCGDDGNLLRRCHSEQKSDTDLLTFAIAHCRAALIAVADDWDAVLPIAAHLQRQGIIYRDAYRSAMFNAGRPLFAHPTQKAVPIPVVHTRKPVPLRQGPRRVAAIGNCSIAGTAF